jgi:hypothetical protein
VPVPVPAVAVDAEPGSPGSKRKRDSPGRPAKQILADADADGLPPVARTPAAAAVAASGDGNGKAALPPRSARAPGVIDLTDGDDSAPHKAGHAAKTAPAKSAAAGAGKAKAATAPAPADAPAPAGKQAEKKGWSLRLRRK